MGLLDEIRVNLFQECGTKKKETTSFLNQQHCQRRRRITTCQLLTSIYDPKEINSTKKNKDRGGGKRGVERNMERQGGRNLDGTNRHQKDRRKIAHPLDREPVREVSSRIEVKVGNCWMSKITRESMGDGGYLRHVQGLC